MLNRILLVVLVVCSVLAVGQMFYTKSYKAQDMKVSNQKLNYLVGTEQFQIIQDSDKYTVYLTGAVEDNSKYILLLAFLNQLTESDKVDFYIQGPGGYMSTGNLIYDAIKDNPAYINMIVYGNVYSMDALLALAGDSLTIRPHTNLMFHVPAYYVEGVGNIKMSEYCKLQPPGLDRGIEIKHKCDNYTKAAEQQNAETSFKRVRIVLDINQYSDMLKGDDVIITGADVLKRISGTKLENGYYKIDWGYE